MADARSDNPTTVALNTKVEDDFVAPLTAVRGALELIRDIKDISDEERARFIETALRGCSHLERSINELATTVYAAGTKSAVTEQADTDGGAFSERVHADEAERILEIDFSDFEFNSSDLVNAFYDEIEAVIDQSGHKWYVLVNNTGCRVWPEAWVAFAHRGKRVHVTASLGTVRYMTDNDVAQSSRTDINTVSSREAALARIAELKAAVST